MKVVAILLLLAVATYAKPSRPKDDGSNGEDDGTKFFLTIIKICKRLEQETGLADKRSWDTVFGLYVQVCQGLKAALEEEVDAAALGKRQGPAPTGDPMSQSGDDEDDKSRPKPTGDPTSRPSSDGDKSRPKPTGDPMSRSGDDEDDKSRPKPTGDPMSRTSADGDKSRPKPTGDPMSRPDKSGSRDGDKTGDMSGPSPTGDTMPEDKGSKKGPKKGPKKGGRKGGDDSEEEEEEEDKRSGPSPTGDPMSGTEKPSPTGHAPTGSKSKSGMGGGKGSKGSGRGGDDSDDDDDDDDGDKETYLKEELLKLCFGIAKFGEDMVEEDGGDKRSLEQALVGMEEVCLAAFRQAEADAVV